jgi:hypothetical protein
MRDSVVVEPGSGVSTLICAYCLEKNGGAIVSVKHLCTTLCAGIEFTAGTTKTYCGIRARHRKVDVLIVDNGPPVKTRDEVRYAAIPVFFDRLADQAIVLVDDAGRPEERATVRRWVTKFPMLNIEYLRWTELGTAILKKGF